MARWRRSPSVAWRVAGDSLVLAGRDLEVITISAPAPAVWELLEEPIAVPALVDRLCAAFGDAPGLDGDVRALLDDLAVHGFAEVVR